jgi:anti-sigma factor RsiW
MTEPLDVAEIEELIGAYALDAVDPDERAAVEAHLVECPRCRAELAEHLETAAYLSYGGAPAPEALWGRIAAALEEPPPAMRLQVVGDPTAAQPAVASLADRRVRPSRRMVGVLAAAAAVIAVVLGAAVIHQRSQIDDLHQNLAASALTRSAQQAEADPASQRLSLTSPSNDAVTATAVISPSGTGYLTANHLPALASDRTYQLWGETGGKVISLGLLGRSPSLVAFSAHGTFHGLAVTDEVAGGVTASSQTPVLTS